MFLKNYKYTCTKKYETKWVCKIFFQVLKIDNKRKRKKSFNFIFFFK